MSLLSVLLVINTKTMDILGSKDRCHFITAEKYLMMLQSKQTFPPIMWTLLKSFGPTNDHSLQESKALSLTFFNYFILNEFVLCQSLDFLLRSSPILRWK